MGRKKRLPREVFSKGAQVRCTKEQGPTLPSPEGPGQSSWDPAPLNPLPVLQSVPRSRAPPAREGTGGPPATAPACLTCAGPARRLILWETNTFSGAAPESHTDLFSTPTNPLIEDKAPVNPHLIKAATKLARTCPRLRCRKQTRGWGLRREMLSPFSPEAPERRRGDWGRDSFLACSWGVQEGAGQVGERRLDGVPAPSCTACTPVPAWVPSSHHNPTP